MFFFEAEFELPKGDPEVRDRRIQRQVAFEVFEGGARLGCDVGADAPAFALRKRASRVGAGRGFERRAGRVQGLDGSDPGPADAEDLGDLTRGHAVVGESDDTVAKRQARIEDALAHMPFAEEVDDTAATQSRSPTIPAKFGKPAPKVAATPYRSPTAASGQVTLNSAKYLNGGKPDFRKGTTRDTSD